MSDDAYLGKSLCCIPRRLFVCSLAAFLLVYGFIEFVYLVFFRWLVNSRPDVAGHCSGTHCFEIASCEGLRQATFHVRMLVCVLGGVFFGFQGAMGALHGRARKLEIFAWFLGLKAVLVLGLVGADWAYAGVCGAFSRNFVVEVQLLPPPYTVESLGAYGSESHLWLLYALRMLSEAAFLAYAALEAGQLAEHVSFGIFGLGINFSIRSWRDSVLAKNAFDGLLSYSRDQTAESLEDIRELLRGGPPREASGPPGAGYGSAGARAHTHLGLGPCGR
eukprot:TRINITY_DN11581_c0_g1_i2.p1 TRINITY_DN11581_c0_g1~~TRINITY_DN11581_c0_g1_i2.p1  ORF type:complete len:276 (-),score=56.34 TRINITY_DN11581_c0_g1_i2:57-884(-)